jgi:lysophospholipase L1-like esterase
VGVGSELPLRDAWTQVFFGQALPRRAVFVNLGIPGATAQDALEREIPYARRLHPDVVTIWLNANDILAGTSPTAYAHVLDRILGSLDDGARVLVANTPPLQLLPAYLACRRGAPAAGPPCLAGFELPGPRAVAGLVSRYNAAISAVAGRHGAVVVDLHSAGVHAAASHELPRLVGPDGFHPSTPGHRRVAHLFARAYR